MGAAELDLGLGHFLRPVQNADGTPWGWIDRHPRPADGAACTGSVMRRGVPADHPRPSWEVIQEEPLTLTPSLLCTACGDHGWVREGKWVPA